MDTLNTFGDCGYSMIAITMNIRDTLLQQLCYETQTCTIVKQQKMLIPVYMQNMKE